MPKRIIESDGERWAVSATGRRTQFTRDEFSLLFTRLSGASREQRVARYSPVGSQSRDRSLADLTDDQLRQLLRRSQPSWTTPETGYRR